MKSDKELFERRWSFRFWARWFVPMPILIWYARRKFSTLVIYQDRDFNLELCRRFKENS